MLGQPVFLDLHGRCKYNSMCHRYHCNLYRTDSILLTAWTYSMLDLRSLVVCAREMWEMYIDQSLSVTRI